ncbi:PhzF family phenazine biosynthesis protein [Angustibacter sp. McL0619]|uniref:PhzF family phenazine biosynthesis protein n=1 Tax=Angustibacter sp. McL0619 TaxID=3415676 RepID=UPI003CF1D22F
MDARRMLDYDVVDVFTDRAFAGNPLAVVHGAQGLSTGQLQQLAREFSYSESAFPMSPTGPSDCVSDDASSGCADYRLRIFTPSGELPFAGHPSIGTAWVLRSRGLLAGPTASQECGAGRAALHLGDADDGLVWLTGLSPMCRGVLGGPDVALALDAVGLVADDLAGPATTVAGAGLDFCFLLVHPDALGRVNPGLAALTRLRLALQDRYSCGIGGVSVVVWPEPAGGPPARLAVRVFSDDAGAVEDPATGSAALGLQAALVDLALLPADGASELVLSQGTELGRPSTLHCRVEARGGTAVRCQVGGQVVPVARGSIRVPPVNR